MKVRVKGSLNERPREPGLGRQCVCGERLSAQVWDIEVLCVGTDV